MTVDTPALASSIILKLLAGLLSVLGVWKILFINNNPLPPLVPIPTVFAPPTLNVKSVFNPVNWSEMSSYMILEE